MANNHELETRPIVLEGKSTSLRVELIYWVVIDEMARAAKLTRDQFLAVLKARQPDDCNSLASWVRVFVTCALRKRLRDLKVA